MTQEEKAKAYDEALERFKSFKEKYYKSDTDFGDVIFDKTGEMQKAFNSIFSELTEREDERIRKGLIEALKTSKTVGELKFILPEPTREEGIAYLEKQKDASKAIEAVDRIDKYIDWHVANAHDMKDSDPEKKYYRGWDDALGKMAGILQDVYSEDEQKEQKGLNVTDFCQPINPDIAKVLPDVINELTWGDSGKQKEQKPKQEPKWLYRLEFKDKSCGLWYNGKGEWCFESGIGSLDDSCKTKTLPMDYDERYKQDGRNWFSSCSKKEDLLHWYSKEDAKTLLNKGFVFTRYLATEYHEYDQQTVFIKETALYREEIDFFELMKEQKPAEPAGKLSRQDYLYQLLIDQLITYSDYEYLIEHKHTEWSEEDERMRSNILNVLTSTRVYTLGSHGTSVYKYNNEIEWLKSLSSNLKKKNEDVAKLCSNEWSKEDEKRVKQLIYDTEAIRAGYEKRKESLGDDFNDELIKDCDEQIKWLKSLRPSWKPSEEQMESLRDTIINTKGYSYSMYLPELYEQLKKLM